MKKIFILVLLILACCINLFGADQKYKEIERLQVESKGKGISKDLLDDCEQKLRANLGAYTDFKIIDTNNEKYVSDTQKRIVKSYNYSNTDHIDAGKWDVPTHILNLTVDIINNIYSVEAKITDYRTNIMVASALATSSKNISEDDLFINPGCLMDNITLYLCKELGIPLSQEEIDYLGSSSNYNRKNNDDENYNEIINSIEKTLDKLRNDERKLSNNPKEQAKLSLIRANIAKEEAELKKVKDQKARALAKEQKAKEEAQNKSSRNAEQGKLLQQIMDNYSDIEIDPNLSNLKSNLITIEDYKREYRKLENGITKIKQENLLKAEEDKEKWYDIIINKKPGLTESDSNGNLTEEAKRRRKEEYEQKCRDIDNRVSSDNSNLLYSKANNGKSLADIKDTIVSNYDYFTKKLENTVFTVTNNDFLVIDYGDYITETHCWPVTCSFVIDDDALLTRTYSLSYNELTGKDYATQDIETYYDTVDLYQDNFDKGIKTLNFKLSFSINQTSISEYKDTAVLAVNDFGVSNIKSNNKYKKIDIEDEKRIRVKVTDDNKVKYVFTNVYYDSESPNVKSEYYAEPLKSSTKKRTHSLFSTGDIFRESDASDMLIPGIQFKVGAGLANGILLNLQAKAALPFCFMDSYPLTILLEDCVDVTMGKAGIGDVGHKDIIVDSLFQFAIDCPVWKDRLTVNPHFGLGFAVMKYALNNEPISSFHFATNAALEINYRIIPIVDFYGELDCRQIWIEAGKDPYVLIALNFGLSMRLLW